jgi:hypothetical protein
MAAHDRHANDLEAEVLDRLVVNDRGWSSGQLDR